MGNLSTFGDLRLGLRDLFDNKAEYTALAVAFQIYRDPLKAKLLIFESVHRTFGGKPLVTELLRIDRVHDTNGRALYFIGKALEALEASDDSIHRPLIDIIFKTVPSLGSLSESYEDEAAHSKDKRKILDENAETLAAFSFGPKHNLKSILTAHVEAGEKFDGILSQRADTVAKDQNARNKEIITLRATTIGILNRFRQAVVDEVAVNQALPRDLESKIFTYFDQMEANRAARRGKPETDDEIGTATPAT
jgi:hypothetical protein